MQFWATSFWQVACSLHAFCMHTCQDWVSQEWIYFDECSWCTHHLSVLQLPIDRSACIFSSWSPECVPPVKIVCSACNLKVQLICDLPDPLPYAGFFMKRRKYYLQSEMIVAFTFLTTPPGQGLLEESPKNSSLLFGKDRRIFPARKAKQKRGDTMGRTTGKQICEETEVLWSSQFGW